MPVRSVPIHGRALAALAVAALGVVAAPTTAAPPRVVPHVTCTAALDDGELEIFWGYEATNAMEVPIGPENHFEPGPEDRGQPTALRSGRVESAFSTIVESGEEAPRWTLDAGTSAADGAPACGDSVGTPEGATAEPPAITVDVGSPDGDAEPEGGTDGLTEVGPGDGSDEDLDAAPEPPASPAGTGPASGADPVTGRPSSSSEPLASTPTGGGGTPGAATRAPSSSQRAVPPASDVRTPGKTATPSSSGGAAKKTSSARLVVTSVRRVRTGHLVVARITGNSARPACGRRVSLVVRSRSRTLGTGRATLSQACRLRTLVRTGRGRSTPTAVLVRTAGEKFTARIPRSAR